MIGCGHMANGPGDVGKVLDFAPLDKVTRENVDEYEKNWDAWS